MPCGARWRTRAPRRAWVRRESRKGMAKESNFACRYDGCEIVAGGGTGSGLKQGQVRVALAP